MFYNTKNIFGRVTGIALLFWIFLYVYYQSDSSSGRRQPYAMVSGWSIDFLSKLHFMFFASNIHV